MQFALSLLLTRLLTPVEYGQMGMILLFLLVGQTFADSGLAAGLVQRDEISDDDETTVFYANLVLGLVVAGLLCAASPLVASFFGQPVLLPLLCVCSIGVFITSLGIVQQALLTRAVEFRTQAKVALLGALGGGLVGVTMAWNGCGVWSLAGQSVAGAAVNLTALWAFSPWRPRGRFRRESLRRLWPFSSKLLASGLLHTTFENVHPLVIARFYAADQVGFYTRASTLAALPATSAAGMAHRVMFPVFARVQRDADALRDELRRVVRTTVVPYFPVLVGLAAVSEPLVRTLLTERWIPCVPYLRILCATCLLYPIHALHMSALMAQGRSGRFLRLEVVKKVLALAALAVTIPFGVRAMVYGMLAHSLVCLVLNGACSRELLRYRFREQFADVGGALLASALMGGAVVALDVWSGLAGAWLLAAEVGAGALLYAVLVVLARSGWAADFWRITSRAARARAGARG